MTTKKKLIIAGVVVLVWGVFGSLFWIGAFGSMRNFIGMGLSGLRGNANVTVAVKDFEPLELVFVTTTAKRGEGTDVYGLLLKEAQKLGAHGILNVKVDAQRISSSKELTWTGSALAIKYTGLAGVPATDNSLGGLSRMRRGFGWWERW